MADPVRCVPPEVVELNAVERTARQEVENGRLFLKLRTALDVLGSDYLPAAEMEKSVSVAERTADEAHRKSIQGLMDACSACPCKGTCPASMVGKPTLSWR